MNLRPEIMKVLRERATGAEAIFESKEAQMHWLFGLPGKFAGLLRDPKAALLEAIPSAGGSASHEGVRITDEESSAIQRLLASALYGERAAAREPGANQWTEGALFCPDPYDPNCWYSVRHDGASAAA